MADTRTDVHHPHPHRVAASDHLDAHPGRQKVYLVLAVLVTVPGLVVRFTGPEISHPLEAFVFGLAVVGAAFLLAWAAEAAQLDISAGLAIAVLAFIAVLPEYAVDMVFSWKGGKGFKEFGRACGPAGGSPDSHPCSLALANMTGSNRLLIGIGWSLVVFLAWIQWRKRGMATREIVLERSHSVEVGFLALASLYALTLPLKGSLTLFDAAILITIFVAYTWRIAKAPAEEPHLVGPALLIGCLPTARRRLVVVLMLVFAAAVILASAEHFAEALVATGKSAGIDEFLLVQWLAPLASEAPELLIAGLYAWRLNTGNGLGTLVSSKVNQWTLLVGTLPIVFAISSGSLHGLPLGSLQRQELLLTGAQAFFAIAILANLSMNTKETMVLFGLFWAQFVVGAIVPERLVNLERIGVSVVYLLLGLWLIGRKFPQFRALLRDGFRTPVIELHR